MKGCDFMENKENLYGEPASENLKSFQETFKFSVPESQDFDIESPLDKINDKIPEWNDLKSYIERQVSAIENIAKDAEQKAKQAEKESSHSKIFSIISLIVSILSVILTAISVFYPVFD